MRRLLSISLAFLFFLETTLFYPVRAMAVQSPPRSAVQSGEPSPYRWRTTEEIVESLVSELEAMETARVASPTPLVPVAPPAPAVTAAQPIPNPGTTTRESVSSTEEEGDRRSNAPSVSADGRYVAFESEARNLVSDDTNKKKDVFVRDRVLGTTTRISVASDGTEANGESGEPAISADGRYVVFESKASNLSPADTNKRWDIFLHDRQNRETIPVTHGDDDSHAPAISADGRYIAFESDAEELVVGDTGHRRDIFVYERDTGEMSLVSPRAVRKETIVAKHLPLVVRVVSSPSNRSRAISSQDSPRAARLTTIAVTRTPAATTVVVMMMTAAATTTSVRITFTFTTAIRASRRSSASRRSVFPATRRAPRRRSTRRADS